MSEGYDTSSLFDGIPMTDAVRNDLNHRVSMHVRSLRLEALAISDTNNDLTAQLSASQARLSEAVKVLEPFADVNPETDQRKFLQLLICPEGDESVYDWAPKFKAVKAFLATLGEEK